MPTAAATGEHRKTAAVAFGLAAVTWLAFGRMVWDAHPFIHLDDWEYVVQNPMVRGGLSLEALAWAFHPTTFVANNWHPITLVSHMLDASLFGVERPWGHHATSLLLHTVNAVLVFLLLRRSTGAFWTSALVAALFAWHPTRVESVAWIAERKDVLSGTFALLTLAAYGRWVQRPGVARYLALVLAFSLGLMAKSMLVTLPFALLLLDAWPLRRLPLEGASLAEIARRGRSLLLEKLPLFALTAAFTAIAFVSQGTTGAVADLVRVPFAARVANAATTCWAYLGKLAWPTDLAVLYPITEKHLTVESTLLALAALAAASAVAWRGRRFGFLPVGWAWYLGTLVPVIGLVQLGSQAMADRYLYLPGLGIFVIVAFGLRSCVLARPGLRTPLSAAVALALAVLVGLTAAQTGRWRSTEALFRHNLRVAGANDIVWSALAVAYDEAGETDRALDAYAKALAENPDSATAHLAIGSIRLRRGEPALAEASLRRAIALGAADRDSRPELWLAEALAAQSKHDEAAEHYARVVARDPDHWRARLRHALALEAAGRDADALASLEATLAAHPLVLEARIHAARILSTPGPLHDPERAVRLARSAWENAPARPARYAEALARAYEAAGRHAEAERARRLAQRRERAERSNEGNPEPR